MRVCRLAVDEGEYSARFSGYAEVGAVACVLATFRAGVFVPWPMGIADHLSPRNDGDVR